MDAVGFHPDNRFGGGLDPTTVYEVLKAVAMRGWSWPKVAAARAFEVSDGGEGEKEREINRVVAEKSDGALPIINPSDVQILAVGCTHNAASLRCVIGKGKPPAEFIDHEWFRDIVDADGHISRDKCLEKFPSYKAPLERGIRWAVVRREVAKAFPRLALFLQEAGNTEHGAEQHISNIDVMCDIHAKSLRNIALHKEPRWANIAKEVTCSVPTVPYPQQQT